MSVLRNNPKRWAAVVAGLVFLFGIGTARATDFEVAGIGGFTMLTDKRVRISNAFGTTEFKEGFLGPGFTSGGRVYVGITERIYVGGGGYVSSFSGTEHDSQFGKLETTTGGWAFKLEAGGLIYLLNRQRYPVCPYAGASIGIGHVSWSFGSGFLSIDTDGVGITYVAPEAGLEVKDENLGLLLGGRLLVTSYGDETSDGLLFEADGHFLEIYVGVSVTL